MSENTASFTGAAGTIADHAANPFASNNALAKIVASLVPSFNNPVHAVALGIAGFFLLRIILAAFTGKKPEQFTMASVSSESVPAKRNFTPRELAEYNGKDEETPLYIAVKGTVYDVSKGRGFYGPGGPYANFSGRDASRGLALGSFDEGVLTSLDDPIDALDDLDKAEEDALDEWATFFAGKYVPIGRLVEPSSESKKEN